MYPFKVYSFRGVIKAISDLVKRKGFVQLLENNMTPDSPYISDIQDGAFYRNFKDVNGERFFKHKRNVGLMINFDFFNPFKNSQYSLGVLYAVIVNLPRECRFLWENVLVLGIIPGPSEPKKSINSFLKPLVKELLMCWSPGICLEEYGGLRYLYRVAVICVSSDLPALRKIAGFLSHNAKKGWLIGYCIFYITFEYIFSILSRKNENRLSLIQNMKQAIKIFDFIS